AHYLSFKPTDNIQIGIYEAVIFQRESGFELQYLNPVILYRTVEHLVGSPDNALIGLDAKANLLHRFQLYGQLMLDELKFDELIVERRGWWANKFGIQAGLKYVDMLGIDHLDGQVEFNIVRPYTFMHRDSFQNYTHYNQPLAHPLGANFKETLFLLRYQPFKKLSIHSRLIFSEYGEDETDANWGSNLLLTYNSREMDYGNNIGQGIHTQTILFGLDVSYEIRQNVFFDLQYLYRKKESALAGRNATTSWFGGGIRMNMGYARMDF
ncbi:MAG: hypothetical protein GY705_11060, partial [Bacteroidetes bacterium]|nr:hypothetical protein [Bacteroidota bacterium]